MGFIPQDPAHFDPTMGNYTDLKPFRFWCQKVLPLVYDDSLSYYEVLCKVVDYLNKTMEDVGVLHGDVDALNTAYLQLQEYVNNYFSTLDVQQEINNKLDIMASDGTLDALLLPYFNAYKADIDQEVTRFENNVTSVVNIQNDDISVLKSRMDSFSHLAEGSTTGDAELTDIRVGGNGITYSSAGDAVRAQYNILNNKFKAYNPYSLYTNIFNPYTGNVGKDVNSSTGELVNDSPNLITSDFIEIDASKRIQKYGEANRYYYAYDITYNYLGYGMFATDYNIIVGNTYPTAKYIRIQTNSADLMNTYLMYYDYRSDTYVPFNPVEGNIQNSKYLEHAFGELVTKTGYFYTNSYLALDTSDTSNVTYTIVGTNNTIICSDGSYYNTDIIVNTSHALSDFNVNYCTIVYDTVNKQIIATQDYTGNHSNYVVLGYYDHGYIYGNMGLITVNGSVSNMEIEEALEEFSREELSRVDIKFGYFYASSYLVLNTLDVSNVTFKIMGNSYVMCNDGKYYNSEIAVNTEYELVGFNRNYCIIVYDIVNKDIIALVDYTGSFENYIVLGYYDHGYTYGNMGMILINGKVNNLEINNALSEYDIGDLSLVKAQVHANTNNIAINTNSIRQEQSARTLADTALSARIDNLVAPTGQSVAEITDARVGYNGTIFSSLEARLNSEEGTTIKRIGNILTVGVNKMFQTIASAVQVANNFDTILIDRGVYEESIDCKDKCLTFIGVAKNDVVWKYPNTEYGEPPLEMGMGILKNLTIYAYDNGETPSTQYGRAYCLHCDFFRHYQEHPPVNNYLYCENVSFVNDNNESVGLGLRPNLVTEFVNCDFKTLSGNESAFYVHSSTSNTTINASCTLKNCTVENNSNELPALKFEGYWETDGGCTAILERNIVVNQGTGLAFNMYKNHHYGSETVENWKGVSDWILDDRSQLNNISDINYQ